MRLENGSGASARIESAKPVERGAQPDDSPTTTIAGGSSPEAVTSASADESVVSSTTCSGVAALQTKATGSSGERPAAISWPDLADIASSPCT